MHPVCFNASTFSHCACLSKNYWLIVCSQYNITCRFDSSHYVFLTNSHLFFSTEMEPPTRSFFLSLSTFRYHQHRGPQICKSAFNHLVKDHRGFFSSFFEVTLAARDSAVAGSQIHNCICSNSIFVTAAFFTPPASSYPLSGHYDESVGQRYVFYRRFKQTLQQCWTNARKIHLWSFYQMRVI